MLTQKRADTIAKMYEKALDKATTVAEAAVLMEKAKKLSERYGATLEDIIAGKVKDDEFGEHMYFGGERCLNPAASLIGPAIMDYCGIKGYRKQTSKGYWLMLFGHDADVELAKYLLTLFKNTLDHGWAVYSQYTMPRGQSALQIKSARQSFVRGFASEIIGRLKAHTQEIIAETGTELIVLKGALVEQKFADMLRNRGVSLGDAAPRRHVGVDHSAVAAGKAHARGVNMGRGVSEGGHLAIGRS